MNTLVIGTGRLAASLCHAFKEAGMPLAGVAGRNRQNAYVIASACKVPSFGLDEDLPAADLILIAVSDDAITSVASMLQKGSGIVAHTSGASPIDLLPHHERRGIFWPVQTFAKGRPVSFRDVPVVIEGCGRAVVEILKLAATSIGADPIELSHEERRKLHLAAVFASNFPVALMQAAQRYLANEGLPDHLLLELWRTTAANVAEMGPGEALTGPASRGDQDTMQRHLELLGNKPELARIYQLLSELIASQRGR